MVRIVEQGMVQDGIARDGNDIALAVSVPQSPAARSTAARR